jgi:FkbM family methyltransferase
MNGFERMVDGVDPGLSARLRALKLRLRQRVVWRLVRDLTGAGDVAVDLGANRGVYTYLMSVMVGREGRVHAVEPFPANYERLRTIARRRGNIRVHWLAVSDRSGTAVLRVPVHRGHPIDALASLDQSRTGPQQRCEVALRTLDELLAGERRIAFVKCDVEGHEQRVFDGAARILGHDRPVVFAEVEQRHREDSIENTFAFFAHAGYRGWFVTEHGLRPLADFDVDRDQVGFLDGRFMPYGMPRGYVNDFLFCPPGAVPPPSARS